jgi:colanic acid/amylovoran biosynthesis glycosyltransferase
MAAAERDDCNVVIWRSLLLPGSETFIRNQGNALTQWRPTFLGALKVRSVMARDTDVIAFPDGVLGRASFFLLRMTGGSRRLRRLVRAAGPAVVHAHHAGDGWLISRTAERLGIPLVITCHGRDVTLQAGAPGRRGVRYRQNLRTAFDRATTILAVSEFMRGKAIDLGADPAKVRVHHTGVPIPALTTPLPKEWDVLFVGRFAEKKGLDDLVEALGALAEPRPKALFIGDGPLLEPIRARAAELGLDATFLGAQEPAAVARRMAESKVFVSPSKTASDGDAEGLPTTILEAASWGLPTISTFHSGIPEAVVHGETGLLGAEGDRIALADSIRLLVSDDDLRARLGHQARAHMEAHFDLRKQTDLLGELYDAIAARTSAPIPA